MPSAKSVLMMEQTLHLYCRAVIGLGACSGPPDAPPPLLFWGSGQHRR
jgi:hypothetical protein